MEWWQTLILFFGGLTLLLCAGLPAGFAFICINLVGAFVYLGGEAGLMQSVRNGIASVTNFSLTPIPFFLLMGELLFRTGVAFKAIDAFDRVIRRVPGRLAVVAVVGGTVFSAISGSSVATTALLGSVLLPEMLRRKYHPRLATGPIMAIGAVDMLIPPSAIAVLLGSLGQISIAGLLIAGLLPGLLLALIFIVFIIIRVRISPDWAPAADAEADDLGGWQRWRALVLHVLPLVAIFVLVVLSMTMGWATPTESAAVGASACLLVCLLHRSLTLKNLTVSLMNTAALTGMILFIIIGASTFSQILAFSGATDGLVSGIRDGGLQPWMVLALMMLILLLLGCFVDQVSMMLMTLPFYMPLMQHFGWDPLWFGVLYLICMQLGLLTPPFGMLVLTMRSVTPPRIATSELFMAVMPYVLFGLLMLVLVILVPGIATWLPAWLSVQ
ncbi:TRAP transporter large permease subunit [Corticibacter populi]|uniref:TRAP transporter large permease protein n=1 Tax=Corticibacter populi TaxID=1550736 RepID=A0A3M6QXI0_9BURK|nr:TRAP transporter large permease subunit [Corticibacter populi]RMX07611.1 TRAP transporter large permease subunit [Corticibacter populi]RZS30111.1 tripartite ATP-independent transporter DctM subunit [Corticibacter populi]